MKGELFEYKGKLLTVQELANLAGVSNAVMCYRLNVCTTIEDVMVKGRMYKRFWYNGKHLTTDELAEIKGISRREMAYLLRRYKGDTQKAMSAKKYKREKNR